MSDINDLSEREREILRLVAGGASNKEIALALTISTNTVKVHLRNIFAKIEVASRTEAAMFAVRSGLVEAGGMPVGSEFTRPDSKPFSDEELITNIGKKVDDKRWLLIAAPFVILVIFVLAFISGRSSQPPLETPDSPPVVTSQTRWQEMASMPTGRSGLAVAVFENQIYAIAGEAIGGVTGVVERYDPPKKSWESLQTKPTPVTDVHAAVIGGRIYVPGGRQSDGAITNIIEIYDPRQDTWEQGSPMPVELCAYAMVAFEGKLFVFGGQNERDYLSLVLIYDPTQDIWEEAEPMPTKRAHAGAAVAGGKIYIIGGYDGVNALEVNEIFFPELINSNENPWSVGEPLPEGRYKLGVTSVADIIYVFGGLGESVIADNTFQSLSQSNNWIANEVQVKDPWSSMGLVPLETKLYILGGQLRDEPTGSMLEYQAIYTILVPMVP
jgi:DNA-binding CsgD family transcriptional regulator/N-acetylneuraminic acid mutarotase